VAVKKEKSKQQKGKRSKSKREEHIKALKEARASLVLAESIFKNLDLRLKDVRKKVDCLPHDPHIGDG
jgi:hypothetical protein